MRMSFGSSWIVFSCDFELPGPDLLGFDDLGFDFFDSIECSQFGWHLQVFVEIYYQFLDLIFLQLQKFALGSLAFFNFLEASRQILAIFRWAPLDIWSTFPYTFHIFPIHHIGGLYR